MFFGFYPGMCTCFGRYQNDPHHLGCPMYVQKPAADVAPVIMGKCTCGTQAVGGLCSDWCDSRKPAVDAPASQGGAKNAHKPPVQKYYVAYKYAGGTVDLSDTFGGPVTMSGIDPGRLIHWGPNPKPGAEIRLRDTVRFR